MAYRNTYRPDRLFLPQQKLLRFAEELPTPFYLYDEAGIRKTARIVQGSFCWNPGHRQFFPLMANRTPAIIQIMREMGFGLLVQNEYELRCAQQSGFSGDRILLHPTALTDSLVELVGRLGCGVVFDALCQVERMSTCLPKRCLLRYQPGKVFGETNFSKVNNRHKSGMSKEQIFEAARLLQKLGVEEIGLHCHLSNNSQKDTYYPAQAKTLFSLAAELRKTTGIRVACCDLGGGIGVDPAAGAPLQCLSHIGAGVRACYREFFPEQPGPALYTELGRYLVGPHGILLSRVVEVRERLRRFAILDASIANCARPMLNSGLQHLSVVGDCRRTGRVVYSVHGCTSDSVDRFDDRAVLPELYPGRLVAIRKVGAYAQSMQSGMCMLPPCPAYIYTRYGEIRPADEVTA